MNRIVQNEWFELAACQTDDFDTISNGKSTWTAGNNGGSVLFSQDMVDLSSSPAVVEDQIEWINAGPDSSECRDWYRAWLGVVFSDQEMVSAEIQYKMNLFRSLENGRCNHWSNKILAR